MKILMISSFLPYPLTSGGHIRLYNLLKNLYDKHEITLICEKRSNQSQDDVSEVEKVCQKVITVTRKKQWSVKNILKTGFSSNPFLVVGHESMEMKLAIRDELVRGKYDLIHVETFYVYQNLPKVSVPVVLVEHNIEYLVYRRYVNVSNPLLKPILYLDVLKLKIKEENAWKKADKLVAVSQTERKLIKRADVEIVPNGVDTSKFSIGNSQDIPFEKRILFIGDFKWIQNRESLEFILKEIWPRILQKMKDSGKNMDLKLWVVGKNIPENLMSLFKSDKIIFDLNNKEETPQIFAKAFMLLAPFRVAGGTSYKVLEAMASGVAVITTNLGYEGLGAKDKTHLLAGQTPQELANLAFSLLTDHSLFRRLTLNARKFVEENYDWKKIAEKLNKIYISSM